MNSKNIKLIRGQIRQVVKELIPELLTEQLVESIQKNLNGQLHERLSKIDERQSQLQSYFVRNAGVPTAASDKK